MPHVIANGLEREATIHQALDASMPESVGPRPGHWNARPMEILAGETGDGRLSQWPTGRDMPPKELPTLCFGLLIPGEAAHQNEMMSPVATE